MNEWAKGKIVSALVPGDFSLGGRLGDWYDKNSFHRFNEGDILLLRKRNIFGYGIRPVAVVNGYEVREDKFGKTGKYDITMYSDREGNFSQWMKQNEVPQRVGRTVSEHEIHFKWNVENQFRRVSVDSVSKALALYASKEVEQLKRVA